MYVQAAIRNYRTLWSVSNIRWLVITRYLSGIAFYSTVIVAYQQSRGLDYAGMFWLESVLSAAIFLFEIPTGLLAERIGYRRMLILGQGLTLTSQVLFALAHGFWLFALSAALFGTGIATVSGCDGALLYESLPDEQRDELGSGAFSLVSAASSGGFFTGLALGSLMATQSPAVPVYATLVPVALAFLASFRLKNSVAASTSHQEAPAPGLGSLLTGTLRLLQSDRRLVALSLFSSAAFALVNAIFWYNQPLFQRAAIPVALFGPLTAVAVAVQMGVALSAPMAGRWLGRPVAVALSALVPGVAFLALRVTTAPVGTLLLVTLVIAGGAWRSPLLSDAINRRIPDGARATVLSSLSFAGTVAGMALNPLIGLAGDAGLGVMALTLGIGLVALAGVALLLLPGMDSDER